MKFLKIYIFVLIVIINFYALNIFAVSLAQFPDALQLQPMPSGVYPGTSGSINTTNTSSVSDTKSNNIQIKPLVNYSSLPKKDVSSGINFFWLSLFVIIVIFIVALIFYVVKKKKLLFLISKWYNQIKIDV